MANKMVNVDNISYCGKEANEIFSKMLYSLDLATSGITMRDNVKGKEKLYTGELDGDLWQEYTCAFTPQGEVKLSEDFIEPVRLKINMEECYDAWDNTYFVEQTKIALNGGIPLTFSEWFFNKFTEKMKKEYQAIFWQADTTYSGSTKKYLKLTDGIEKQLKVKGAATITGSQITTSNVIAQVEAVITAGEAAVNAQEVEIDDNFVIVMNYQDVRTLKTALGKLCCEVSTEKLFNNYTKEGDTIYINGYKVVPSMCSKNTIIWGPIHNAVLGYDTADSQTEYKLIDMRETTAENMFRILALSNIAVGVVFADLFAISSL